MSEDARSRGSATDDARDQPSETVRVDGPTLTQNDLDITDVFEVLGDSRRRYLMYAVVARADECSLQELATDLVAWETDQLRGEVSDRERNPAQIELYHHHLPKLADLDALNYYHDDDVVVVTEGLNTEDVYTTLARIGGERDARQEAHASGNDPE